MADEHLGVCILLLNPERTHFLAGKRLGGYGEGYYGLPGGRLHFGEFATIGASRELLEETSIKSDGLWFSGVIRDFRPGAYSFIHFAFACTEYVGEPRNLEPDRCAGWEWVPFTGPLPLLLPGHLAAVKMYRLKNSYHFIDIVSTVT